MTATVTRRRLVLARLTAHRLRGAAADVVEAARGQLATQAQNLNGACWSLAQRTAAGTTAAVRAALDAGTLVQTWPMRGTLHVMAAEDARWLLALLGRRTHKGALATIWRRDGLDADTMERARDILAEALPGRNVSRPELLRILAEGGVDAAGPRASHVIRFLAETGTLVIGPGRGTTQTLALLDDRVSPAAPLEPEAALRRLAVRYVEGHGPATDRDLAWWSGLTLTDARAALAAAAPDLDELECDGVRYWAAPGALDAVPPTARLTGTLLLAGFDEYHLGYADRALILDPGHADLMAPSKNGLFAAPILDGGRIVGAWRAEVGRDAEGSTVATVRLTPWREDAPGRLLERVRPAAERYARAVGTDRAEVTVGDAA